MDTFYVFMNFHDFWVDTNQRSFVNHSRIIWDQSDQAVHYMKTDLGKSCKRLYQDFHQWLSLVFTFNFKHSFNLCSLKMGFFHERIVLSCFHNTVHCIFVECIILKMVDQFSTGYFGRKSLAQIKWYEIFDVFRNLIWHASVHHTE